jgi:hypothetical protein
VFERFTDRARKVLVLAQEEARILGHSYIGSEHVLLGLIHEGGGIAARALTASGASLEIVRLKVAAAGAAVLNPSGSPPFTPRTKKALELGLREALQRGHNYIGTEHLLLGLLRQEDGEAIDILVDLGIDLDELRARVVRLMSGSPDEPNAQISKFPASDPRGRATGTDAELVACSFCGRQPPESGRLVSSLSAFICEHCVKRWAQRLGEHGHHEERFPRRGVPTGPPLDQKFARDQITTVFSNLAVSEDGQAVPMVERGDRLGPTLSSVSDRGITLVVSIVEISFTGDGAAVVWFDAVADGTPMLTRHRGEAILIDGAWKMEHRTFAQIMTAAGVPFPPD